MNKQIKISLEEARGLFGKHSDLDKLILRGFTKEQITGKGLPKLWGDINNMAGYYVNTDSEILYMDTYSNPFLTDRNLFKFKVQAESSLAAAQLSQLMIIYNEGWIPNWHDFKETKYCIQRKRNYFEMTQNGLLYNFLAFKNPEIAESFLTNFESLIKTYYEMK